MRKRIAHPPMAYCADLAQEEATFEVKLASKAKICPAAFAKAPVRQAVAIYPAKKPDIFCNVATSRSISASVL
jgi:hypothetical protein